MGKRSRKRAAGGAATADREPSTRAERDAARQRRVQAERRGETPSPGRRARPGRTSAEDRPKPVWAPFPLTELVIGAGIVLMVWGFVSGAGREANARLVTGLALASLAGLELAVREHVTGFRSHSSLLAGAVAVLVIVGLGLGAGITTLGVLLIGGAAGFAGAFVGLRRLFQHRSGGLSFR